MVLECASGFAGGQVPQAQSLVPRAGKSVVSVRGEDDVADEVRVAVQALLRDAVVGLVTGQFPHDQSLVCEGNERKMLG